MSCLSSGSLTPLTPPPWRQPRGKSWVNLRQMPPDSGGVCVGVDLKKHRFSPGVSPGWPPLRTGSTPQSLCHARITPSLATASTSIRVKSGSSLNTLRCRRVINLFWRSCFKTNNQEPGFSSSKLAPLHPPSIAPCRS
jgi:hypothetical protein